MRNSIFATSVLSSIGSLYINIMIPPITGSMIKKNPALVAAYLKMNHDFLNRLMLEANYKELGYHADAYGMVALRKADLRF